MVQIIAGAKGEGKTKKLIECANEKVKNANGRIVYIDTDNKHMYDLNYNIRFIAATEYCITSKDEFYGFVSGISSRDSDIENIYIDGISKTVKNISIEDLEALITKFKNLSEKYNFDITLGFGRKAEEFPESIKQYII